MMLSWPISSICCAWAEAWTCIWAFSIMGLGLFHHPLPFENDLSSNPMLLFHHHYVDVCGWMVSIRFTQLSYIQSSPKPRWNSLNHNSNNTNPTVLETYKNLGTLAEKTYFSTHTLFKKPYQEECTTKLLQEMKSETTTPDWGCRNLP